MLQHCMKSRKAKNQSSIDEKQQNSPEPSQKNLDEEAETATVIPEVVEELTENELEERHRGSTTILVKMTHLV